MLNLDSYPDRAVLRAYLDAKDAEWRQAKTPHAPQRERETAVSRAAAEHY